MDQRDDIRSRRYQQEALGYLELGMVEHALAALDRIPTPGSHLPFSLYLRGEALRTLERHEEALSPLIEAAVRDPDVVEIRLAIGWCHKRLGRIDLAIDALEDAAAKHPEHALLRYNLACYYALTGDRGRTLSNLSGALMLEPSFVMLIDDESDFDAVRRDPDFVGLVDSVRKSLVG